LCEVQGTIENQEFVVFSLGSFDILIVEINKEEIKKVVSHFYIHPEFEGGN